MLKQLSDSPPLLNHPQARTPVNCCKWCVVGMLERGGGSTPLYTAILPPGPSPPKTTQPRGGGRVGLGREWGGGGETSSWTFFYYFTCQVRGSLASRSVPVLSHVSVSVSVDGSLETTVHWLTSSHLFCVSETRSRSL